MQLQVGIGKIYHVHNNNLLLKSIKILIIIFNLFHKFNSKTSLLFQIVLHMSIQVHKFIIWYKVINKTLVCMYIVIGN